MMPVSLELSNMNYFPFTLKEKKTISHNTTLYIVDYPYKELSIPLGQHISIKASIQGQNVTRPYTPVACEPGNSIHLLIKEYPNGKMSQYLKTLPVGSEIELSGPIGHIRFNKNDYKSITMIAGGTGITPFYPILKDILHDPTSNIKVNLIYCNRSEADILLLGELEKLKEISRDRFNIVYFLEQLDKPKPDYLTGYLNKKRLNELNFTQDVYMICGPPAMEQFLNDAVLADTPPQNKLFFTKAEKAKSTVPHEAIALKTFTKEEVAKHFRKNDCWIICKGKVYDITNFVDEHPGGYIIMDGAGKDATNLMFEEFPHSVEAIEQMEDYLIGKIEPENSR
jgi:NAD(P)H-flavin reductase/predicted heme/steroid binding protein